MLLAKNPNADVPTEIAVYPPFEGLCRPFEDTGIDVLDEMSAVEPACEKAPCCICDETLYLAGATRDVSE